MEKGLVTVPSFEDESQSLYNRYNKPFKQQTTLCKNKQIPNVHKNHYHSINKLHYNNHTSNTLTILHQNIRRIHNKIDEFLISVNHNQPHVICLSEHHLGTEEIGCINLRQYTLGASFCRKMTRHGGVCIFVPKNTQFYNLNLEKYTKEKDFEICALRLHILIQLFYNYLYLQISNRKSFLLFKPT